MAFCTLIACNKASFHEVEPSNKTSGPWGHSLSLLRRLLMDLMDELYNSTLACLKMIVRLKLPSFGQQPFEVRSSGSRCGVQITGIGTSVATAAVVIAGFSCVWNHIKSVQETRAGGLADVCKEEYLNDSMPTTLLILPRHLGPYTFKIRMMTFFLLSIFCVRQLGFRQLFCIFAHPKLFAPIFFKIPCMHKAVLLVLYLGASSVSAVPSHRVQQQATLLGKRQTTSTVWTVQLKGWPNTGYCAMMRFGINMQQTFCMLVDTGSANTAVATTADPALGNHEFFDMSLSGEDFTDMGESVRVTYSSGEWSGHLVRDKVGFGDFSMEMCQFSLITSSTEFFIEGAEWVGILGLAYKSLAKPDSGVGTVWDSIRESNELRDMFTLQLCPPKESTLFPGTFVKQGGYMTLGGINNSLGMKQMYYTSVVEERFFSVLLTKIAVGDKTISMSCKEFNDDKTIVDSGTTDIFFPTKVFQEVKKTFSDYFKDGIPLDVPDEFWVGEQKLLWQAAYVEEIYQSFPTLYLGMATDDDEGQEFCLAVVPQLYLRQIDVQAGEADPAVCPTTSPCDAFTFGVKPRSLGTVIGANSMLGYYTVFDRENKRIGFSESTCEYRSSSTAPYISGPYAREPEDCRVDVSVTDWDIVTYTCGAVTMLLAVTIMITVTCVRVIRRTRYTRKITLPRSMGTKLKTELKSMVEAGICCAKHVDEGYVHDMSTHTSLDTDHDDAVPCDDTDFDESMTPDVSTPTAACHELIVPIPVVPSIETQQTIESRDAAVTAGVEEGAETDGGGEEAITYTSTMRVGRKWRKKHFYPVMESGTLDQGALCVPSLASNHSSQPGTAMVRADYGQSTQYNEYGVNTEQTVSGTKLYMFT